MNVVTESKVLERYESKSKPGSFNEIRLGRDGAVYCSCWQWRINKWCKHLDRYHKIAPPAPLSEPVTAIKFFESDETKQIDEVITSIGGGVWHTN